MLLDSIYKLKYTNRILLNMNLMHFHQNLHVGQTLQPLMHLCSEYKMSK